MPCDNIPLRDRQYFSFYEDPVGSGIWKQRTSTSGTFTQSGLSIDHRVTTMQVTDVAVPIPAVALADRNELVIHNKSTETVYIGKSNVTSDTVIGTTSGFEISPNAFQNISIKPNIVLYAIVEAGKTAIIKVWEVA